MLTFINFPDPLRLPRDAGRAEGLGHRVPEAATTTPGGCGTTGSATSTRRCKIDHSLRGTVAGKVVLVTGGSSGIGLAAACKFAEAGAITVICAPRRGQAGRGEAGDPRRGRQGRDRRDLLGRHRRRGRAARRLVDWLNANHGGVDFLINNAGRSIRRAIEASYDRFHDFERTMQLNYFGCLRVTMGFLPGMVAKKQGPHRQHQLDRRADQRAALLGLRRLEGGARRLDPLRLERVRRHGHHVHHHQHAAGAHADDRRRPRSTTTCRCSRPRTRPT